MKATAADRQRAQQILDTAPLSDLGTAIAETLAEERLRERSTWNPMIGRVLQVVNGWRDAPKGSIRVGEAAELIDLAIIGDEP